MTTNDSEHGARPNNTLKTSLDNFTFEICSVGVKSERLKTNATNLLSTDQNKITVVTELPTYANKHVDYLSMESTFTVCRLRDEMRRAKAKCHKVQTNKFFITYHD